MSIGIDITVERWNRKALFDNAIEGKWDEVEKTYKDQPWAGTERITEGGDTALHIAISDCNESVVEELVEAVFGIKEYVLGIQNKQGNTPLHLAASIGNVSMCRIIADFYPPGLLVRNAELETPLFLAARCGKIKAFSCLQHVYENAGNERKEYLSHWNKKGETILHCAITGGHLKLAFLIIQLHGDLVHQMDHKGFSPLHRLADKPTAFKSGTYLSLVNKIIYACIFVPDSDHTLISGDDDHSQNQTLVRYMRKVWDKIEIPKVTRLLTMKPPTATGNTRQNIEEGTAGSPINKEKRMLRRYYCKDPYVLPPNYDTCSNFIKLLIKTMLSILFFGLGLSYIEKIHKKKENNIWAAKLMDILLEKTKQYEYDTTGKNPLYVERIMPYDSFHTGVTSPYGIAQNEIENEQVSHDLSSPKRAEEGTSKNDKGEQEKEEVERLPTPILMAARNGISEMVERILGLHPKAIHDIDSEKKNLLLLAVENRHPHVFELLQKKNILKDRVFGAVDKKGNSALHLAARCRVDRPWLIPGAALQMQWDVKWYEYVKQSMPPNFFPIHNDKEETAKQIFTHEHKDLVEKGGKWLTKTSTSCSVVATLIATVAFATSTAVPGGTKEASGKPNLEQQPAFRIFAISSLIALCFSVTSTVMFLSILTSRYQEKDFSRSLPRKLLIGLTSLFISILSIMVTFCAGHFFLLGDELRIAALPVYAGTCLPATFFAIAQLPLYLDIIWAIFSRLPRPCLEDN